jgi:hypothetical protein
MIANEDLDRWLAWSRGIGGSDLPTPVVLDPEEGVLAEVCAGCDEILAVVTVLPGGVDVNVYETEHGPRHRREHT